MNDQDPMDVLFAAARANPPVPDQAFMARVTADALAAQPAPRALPRQAKSPRVGLWRRWTAALGGALSVAGIGSAAMAGLVIGYVQPDPLLVLTDSVGITLAGETLELLPGLDGLLSEE